MKANASEKRNPVTLRSILETRLAAYSVVAGAALVVAACPAQAEVVFTPNHTSMVIGTFYVDLNHDGLFDFSIKDGFFYSSRFPSSYLNAYGLQSSNGVAVISGESAAALNSDDLVGSSHLFDKKVSMEREGGGPWKRAFNRSLGVKFLIRGEVHYGWIGFRKVDATHGVATVEFYGWAYETQPNKPIRAGDMGHGETLATNPNTQEPEEFTTLELMSAGHLGIAELRRRVDATHSAQIP